jgi:hypothetical protein
MSDPDSPPHEPSPGRIDEVVDELAQFAGSFLRTALLLFVQPGRAASRLLADGTTGPRRYATPISFLIVGSLFLAFGMAVVPLDGGEATVAFVGAIGGLVELALSAMELDPQIFRQLGVAALIAAGVFVAARTWERTAPGGERVALRAVAIYALMSAPLALFPAYLLFVVSSVVGLPQPVVLTLSGALLAYGVLVAPWRVVAGWGSASLTGWRRTVQMAGSGLLSPLVWSVVVLVRQPVDDAFAVYETPTMWLAPVGDAVVGPGQLVTLKLEGQLERSQPADLCEPQLCPAGEPTEAPGSTGLACLPGEFDRAWVPGGETFHLQFQFTLPAGRPLRELEGWQLCCLRSETECFSGFQWPDAELRGQPLEADG